MTAEVLRCILRELSLLLTSSWPPARVEGGVRPAVLGQDPLDPVDPGKNSKKLVLEQHSITFGSFAGPKTTQKSVFEQHSITFDPKA